MAARLSQREKLLGSVVFGILLIIVNLLLIRYFLKNHAALRDDRSGKELQLQALQKFLADAPLWQQREAWLQTHQPKLENVDGAPVQFMDYVTGVAKKHTLLLDGQQAMQVARKPEYASAPVKIGIKGSWEHLLDFLNEVQGPEKFTVFESATLTVDPQNPTQMQANLNIAKWYAPK